MNDEILEMLDPTPKLKSKKCRFFSLLLRLFLQFGIYMVAFLVWYFYDYFIAIASLMASFIVMGIIRSKIRNAVIPLKQTEHIYSDKEIADWFVSKEFCLDASKQELEIS
jgi:ABC-type multidrug transport system fused ATPase/permease subunit